MRVFLSKWGLDKILGLVAKADVGRLVPVEMTLCKIGFGGGGDPTHGQVRAMDGAPEMVAMLECKSRFPSGMTNNGGTGEDVV